MCMCVYVYMCVGVCICINLFVCFTRLLSCFYTSCRSAGRVFPVWLLILPPLSATCEIWSGSTVGTHHTGLSPASRLSSGQTTDRYPHPLPRSQTLTITVTTPITNQSNICEDKCNVYTCVCMFVFLSCIFFLLYFCSRLIVLFLLYVLYADFYFVFTLFWNELLVFICLICVWLVR